MFAGTSRTNLRYVLETVFGTIPATPVPENLRLTGESLTYTIGSTPSAELRGDRQTLDLAQTSASASGGFNFELSYNEYDALLEAVLQGTWAAGVLKNGVTQRSFCLEKEFSDVGQFFIYKGMVADTLSLNFASGAMVTGSFGFMGKSGARADATQLIGAPTTSTPYDIINAVSGVGTILEGGVPLVGTFVKTATLSIANKLRGQTAIGTLGNVGIGSGMLEVKGTLEVYLANGDLYDKFVAGTASSFSLIAQDATGNKYTIDLPKIKYSDAKVVAGGRDADAMIALPFDGLMDPTAGAMIVITRDPA